MVLYLDIRVFGPQMKLKEHENEFKNLYPEIDQISAGQDGAELSCDQPVMVSVWGSWHLVKCAELTK